MILQAMDLSNFTETIDDLIFLCQNMRTLLDVIENLY